jgi:hypothetical protein
MSLDLFVNCPKPMTIDSILRGQTGLTVLGADKWPKEPVEVYRDNVSTRTIAMFHNEAEFNVKIPIMAAPEDFDLAIDIVNYVATASGSMVRPERGGPVSPGADLPKKLAPLIEQQMNLDLQAICALASTTNHALELFCPVRPFWFGKRLADECISKENSIAAYQNLVASIRRVQYCSNYYCARTFIVDGGRKTPPKLAVWGPGCPYLFPRVDFLVVQVGEQEFIMIPYGALPLIASESPEYVDEFQALVAATTMEKWNEVVTRARLFEVSLQKVIADEQ